MKLNINKKEKHKMLQHQQNSGKNPQIFHCCCNIYGNVKYLSKSRKL